ncbi:UROD/MetE-like protein [Coprinopsis marcescibilis]|uniref:UROD/MetE-like protein n=1 Tax=Coprinopsis marcescibilis TaxID=230819 RepID=A0A5C3LNN8_COPMA|nr:UROD/MetE-like protein [Coprinopsis marcescibilis]
MHLNPPFRADHIGSLLRPSALFEKRQQLEDKKCTLEDVRALEDDAIKRVVELQRQVGIKSITDGELRREMFFENVFDRLEGMTFIPNRPIHTFKPYIPHQAFMYAAGMQEAPTIYCTGKIKRTRSFYVDEFKYTKSLVPPEEVKNIKVTICSPSWFHQRHGSDMTYDLSVYNNDDEYFNDLATAYRAEFQELYYLGCRRIQIDDPTFCYFCNENMISGMEGAGVDHEALLDTYIRAINLCTEGRPDDLTVSVHMCRGNFKGGVHFSEGGYQRIALKVFNTLDVDVFYLEYDTERAGDLTPLKHFPLDKVAVLGFVTTKNPKLESVEEIKARVNEAVGIMSDGNPKRSKEVALNQLCISTQCGFASVWQGNPLTEEDEKNKLALLVNTAKEIWDD